MNNVKKLINKYARNPYRYTFKKKVIIVDTDDGPFVFKRRSPFNYNNYQMLFKYLKSRNFDYLPDLVATEEEYDVYKYIEEIETPRDQKVVDLVYLLTLLHNKTSFYREIDQDEYKEIYEKIINQLEYLYYYYTNLITFIEQNVYMSPSEYLLARNISKIYMALYFCQKEINEWYELVKEKTKKRLVTIHNNLDIDHLIHSEQVHLLSWDQARIESPIYDFYSFYKRNALEFDFSELFRLYESKYPLLEEERKLLFVLLSIPDKIELNSDEYENCCQVRQKIDYLYKTETLITPYYTIEEVKET